MGNRESRSRVCREGWTGRRRNYICRKCGARFQHDGGQLPEKARICTGCLKNPEYSNEFKMAFAESRR